MIALRRAPHSDPLDPLFAMRPVGSKLMGGREVVRDYFGRDGLAARDLRRLPGGVPRHEWPATSTSAFDVVKDAAGGIWRRAKSFFNTLGVRLAAWHLKLSHPFLVRVAAVDADAAKLVIDPGLPCRTDPRQPPYDQHRGDENAYYRYYRFLRGVLHADDLKPFCGDTAPDVARDLLAAGALRAYLGRGEEYEVARVPDAAVMDKILSTHGISGTNGARTAELLSRFARQFAKKITVIDEAFLSELPAVSLTASGNATMSGVELREHHRVWAARDFGVAIAVRAYPDMPTLN